METAFWQNLDTSNFNVFIRDLSSSVNINLKHMIEDFDKEVFKGTEPKKLKKKDLIIQEQNKKRYNKFVDDDKKTIAFLLNNVNDKNPYLNFENLKTDEGKLEYKFQLLERYWSKKNKYISHVFILYYHLKDQSVAEERQKLFHKIEKVIGKYESKLFMFSNLGNLLPPLNFWDRGPLKLDSWQEDVIRMIKNNKSIIVRAPTSSGKTFIAMATGIIHNKILYVCPAKPVAYQVGANFIKMGYKVHFLIEGHAHLTFQEKTDIFVGIPETIERYIYKIGNHFNYAVFDEIHNLNDPYENIIKLLDCNFLALSATIKNKEYLQEKFKEYYPSKKIEYIEYNTRFINQQRWIFSNDKLSKLHPLTCLEENNFRDFKEISFTPHDCSRLYEKLSEVFEDTDLEDLVEELSPDNYFKENKLLTLDDTREYEKVLKDNLEIINKDYPVKIGDVLNSFDKEVKENSDSFVSLFTKCKEKDLLPMIMFHTDETIAREIFNIIDMELRETESSEYPFHYDILKKKKELYEEYNVKRDDYSSKIKIKTKDAFTEKKEKMMDYDNNEKQRYISSIIHLYNQCISKCKDTENEKNKIKNLQKELNEFTKHPDFCSVDEFKKHKDFCFTPVEPMSADDIRSIRREIKKTAGKKISYEDPIFQLLKRGIGIYIQSMPEEYNWIVQRLMAEKKLGIVISDKTLCMGIDLPIRSVCFTGYKNPNFTKEDYLQMSGRAGRRGHDTQGHIIFHNIQNYKELMKGQLPELKFADKELNESYRIINKLNQKIDLSKLLIKHSEIDINPKLNKLLWYLKDYEKSFEFVKDFHKYEKKLFLTTERDREYTLFTHIQENLLGLDNSELLKQYKANQIEDKNTIRDIGSVCKDIINCLHPITYKIIVENSRKIFIKIKS